MSDIYYKIKRGHKFHIVFELLNILTNPICGLHAESYIESTNDPGIDVCRNCVRILNSPSFITRFANAIILANKIK